MPQPANTSGVPASSPSSPPMGGGQLGRELIAAIISIVVLAVAMWAFVSTFAVGREAFTGGDATAREEAYERQKDLLMIAMGLLGTVTGYYLGRAPAELRAQTAQGLLNDATAVASQANENSERVKQDARAAADAALRALQMQEARESAVAARRVAEEGPEPDRAPSGTTIAIGELEGLLRRI